LNLPESASQNQSKNADQHDSAKTAPKDDDNNYFISDIENGRKIMDT
jgi:hypothetical protein